MVGSMLDDPKILKKIVEHNLDIITIIDVKGNILYESPAVERVLGYKPGELAGKSVFDQIHEKDLHKGSRLLKQALLNPSHEVRSELRYRHKNGHWILLEFVGRPIFEKGMLGTIIISSRDISEKADAEARLKESAERYKSFFESSGFGMIVIDTKGKLLDINMTLVSLMGYHRKNELIGKSIWEFHSKENVKQGKKCLSQTLIKGKHFFEIPLLKKNGSVFIAEVNLSTFFEKGETFVQGVVKDITEERHAGARLRESEEQYRLLAENSADIIWTMDRKLNFTYLSPSLNNVLGFSPEEWIGTSLASHFSSVKKFAAASKHALDAMRRPKGFIDVLFETSMPHKNGKEIPVEIHGTLLKDVKGKIIGVQGTTREISERKKNEQELRLARERFTRIFESSNDGYVILGLDNTILDCNKAYAKLLKYSKEELVGKSFYSLTPKKRHTWQKKNVWKERLLKTGYSGVYQKEYIRKDGVVIPVELEAYCIFEGKKPQYLWAVVQDISEWKHIEEQIEKVNDIINQSPMVAIRWRNSEGWPVEQVSKNVKELFGYTVDEFTSERFAFGKVIHPDDVERVAQEVEAISRKKGTKRFSQRYRIIRKDGTERTIEDVTLIVKKKGKITHYEGIIWDVTESERSHKEREESEKALKTIFETTSEGIMMTDANSGKLTYVNPAAALMLGYEKDDLLGRVHNVVHPKGAKHPLSAVCGGSGKGDDAVSISIPFIRKDRNVIYCDIATSLMKIGGKELIVNFIRDITERRNRENEMAKHVADLERFNAMVINRELKMIELKKRVQELEEALEKKE
jgi:PAS domain S-box-containing protein